MLRLLLSLLLIASAGCASMRDATVERDASPGLRAAWAGKTLECAGKKRETAVYAALGSLVASSVATGLATSVSQAAPGSGLALGLVCASCTMSVTALGLSVFSYVETIDAAKKDQMAGRLLAGESRDGCVMGELPREVEPRASTPASIPPPASPVAVDDPSGT